MAKAERHTDVYTYIDKRWHWIMFRRISLNFYYEWLYMEDKKLINHRHKQNKKEQVKSKKESKTVEEIDLFYILLTNKWL